MSALGQKRTSEHVHATSALPPKADIGTQSRDVRFVPTADITRYLNSVPYLLAISFNCCLLRCIGGTPGRVAISRKKHSSPAGATVQSRTSSSEAFSMP